MIECEICGQNTQDLKLDSKNTLDRCPACTHLHRDIVRCRADLREHAWGGVGIFDKIRHALTFSDLKKQVKKYSGFPPKRGAELGFGSGAMLARMADEGVAMEGTEAYLLECAVVPGLENKAKLLGVSAEDWKQDSESLQMVYAIHVIEHLLDPKKVFQKVADSLQPGGIAYFVTPNGDSLGLKWFGSSWWNLEDPTHIRFFTPTSLRKALANAGFKKIKIELPWWDSLVLEASSVMRKMSKGETQHGILQGPAGQATVLFLLPIFLVLRFFIPNLRPSVRVVAIK